MLGTFIQVSYIHARTWLFLVEERAWVRGTKQEMNVGTRPGTGNEPGYEARNRK